MPQKQSNAAGQPIPFRGGYWQKSFINGEFAWPCHHTSLQIMPYFRLRFVEGILTIVNLDIAHFLGGGGGIRIGK